MQNSHLKDYRLTPLTQGAPQHAVIFLHGLGDRGDGGLLEIGRIWQNMLPDCVFLCPDAPFEFDMAPPDFGGRQWFSLKSFTPDEMLKGALFAAPFLNSYIDHVLKEFNLTPDKLFIVGFSQGTMMALHTMLRRDLPVAGILGYSGMLLAPALLKTEKRSSPPVMLIHGTLDPVVPYAALAASEQGLKDAGVNVETVTCRCEHTIDDMGLNAGVRFIKKIWG
jgi:phospholipase/carboxylesterase